MIPIKMKKKEMNTDFFWAAHQKYLLSRNKIPSLTKWLSRKIFQNLVEKAYHVTFLPFRCALTLNDFQFQD